MLARVLLTLVALWEVPSQEASATPLIAVREADNCAGCHNKGRGQKPLIWRRCTLDCAGCHIDPNGAGARNQWGYYYSMAELPSLRFFDPVDPLKDTSRFDLHYDGRIIYRQKDGTTRQFPMNSEITARLRPFIQWLHLTWSANVMGRIGYQQLPRPGNKDRNYVEKYSAMIDGLPMNLYVRGGRGTPLYSQRRSNHSLWIRERIGLDQFSLTDAVTFGGSPNVPFFHISLMEGDHRKAPEDRQEGVSWHGGMRGVSFGWNVHASGWKTSSKKSSIEMNALGGGFKLFDILVYGERNWRSVVEKELSSAEAADLEHPALRSHPSSTISDYEVAYVGLRGLSVGVHWEEMHLSNQEPSDRTSFVVDLHPIPWLQFEFWQRQAKGPGQGSDTLAVVHVYADF